MDPSNEFMLKQKRARGQLSCTPCRVGKLKCNRLRDPACDQCIKRNREAACQYALPPVKAKSITNVKGRVRQLESLVKDLMHQQSQNKHSANHGNDAMNVDQPTPPSDDNDSETAKQRANIDAHVERSFGQLEINKEGISYKGENHWQTILSSLHDIEKDLANDDDNGPERPDTNQSNNGISQSSTQSTSRTIPDCILGHVQPRTREELIKMIPAKNITDRLLSLCFNSPDPLKILIHAPTFQEEYKSLWRDQSVSTMWLGLLFALLSQAEAFGLRSGELTPLATREQCADKVGLYSSLAASAAVLADYTKPKEYTLECLMIYMTRLRLNNVLMNAWLVMGLIIRLALRMGYHRDPDHYPKISAFQAEMRRRVWAMTSMIDVLMSFQLGLPSMVRAVASDTLPPKNLLDRDFGPYMGILPVGREEHELTPSLYTRAKLRLMRVFSEAAELSHSILPPSLDTILKLDRDLQTAKDDIPPALRMPNISELVTDQAEQLMCRFNLDLLYHKTKIVLFRRYMLVPLAQLSQSEQENGIGEGRLACISSARIVLEHHHTIWEAIQPGGQLENMKWYMGSISTHDFLLAAMVVCLELSQQLERDRILRISNSMECPTRGGMMRALERSHDIWSSYSGLSDTESLHLSGDTTHVRDPHHEETEKARKAMGAMLNRLKMQYPALKPDSAPSAQPDPLASVEQYRRAMGLTRETAKEVRKQKGPYGGVVTYHNWDSIPDSFQFSSLASASKSPSTDPSSGMSEHTSSVPSANSVSLQDLNVAQELSNDDSMNLDWQAWDNEVFNMPQEHFLDWNPQALPTSLAQMPQQYHVARAQAMQNQIINPQDFGMPKPSSSADATDVQSVPWNLTSWSPFFPIIPAANQNGMAG